MSDESREELLRRAKAELSAEEQTRLAEELLQSSARPNGTRSILELKGLGKEIWKGIDAAEYVENERRSWD